MKKIFTITLVMLVAVSMVQAQTVAEVFDKYHKAIGGKELLKSIKSMKVESTLRQGPNEMGYTTFHKRPNKLRTEVLVQGMKIVSATNGKRAWAMQPGMAATVLSQADTNMTNQQANLDGQFRLDDPTLSFTYVGIVNREGYNCHQVDLVVKGTPLTSSFYFEKDSGLLVGSLTNGEQSGMKFEAITSFSDYRKTSIGLLAAHSIKQAGVIIEVKKIEYNIGIDDSIFELPAN